MPAGQSVHSEAPVPGSEYLPAAQATQAVEAMDPDSEDVPAAQLEHDEPASEYVPAAQATQAVEAVDPDGEDVPAGQLLQTEAPVTDLYFPTAHAAHEFWSGPVNPGGHKHADGLESQLRQEPTAEAPGAEYVPAGQSVQTVEADDAAYFPATQVAQVEATVEPKASENVPSPQSAKTVAA